MAQATCPPDVLLALARASSACYGIERNQVCIGSGDVSLQSTDGALIEQTGQIMPLNGTWIITLANGDDPAVAQLQVQARLVIRARRLCPVIQMLKIIKQSSIKER